MPTKTHFRIRVRHLLTDKEWVTDTFSSLTSQYTPINTALNYANDVSLGKYSRIQLMDVNNEIVFLPLQVLQQCEFRPEEYDEAEA